MAQPKDDDVRIAFAVAELAYAGCAPFAPVPPSEFDAAVRLQVSHAEWSNVFPSTTLAYVQGENHPHVAVITADPSRGGSTLTIAFRGSVSLSDWAADFTLGGASASSSPGTPGDANWEAELHEGFRQRSTSAGGRAAVLAAASYLRENPMHRVIFAGHSLGSAVAEVCFLRLLLDTLTSVEAGEILSQRADSLPRCLFVGFASPVVGTRRLGDLVRHVGAGAVMHHYQTEHDLVPLLSNAALSGSRAWTTHYANSDLWFARTSSVATEVGLRAFRRVAEVYAKSGQADASALSLRRHASGMLDLALGRHVFSLAYPLLASAGVRSLEGFVLTLSKAHGYWHQQVPPSGGGAQGSSLDDWDPALQRRDVATTMPPRPVPQRHAVHLGFMTFPLLDDDTIEDDIQQLCVFDAHQLYVETPDAAAAVKRLRDHGVARYRLALSALLGARYLAMRRAVDDEESDRRRLRFQSTGTAPIVHAAFDALEGLAQSCLPEAELARFRRRSQSTMSGALSGLCVAGAVGILTGGLAAPLAAGVCAGWFATGRVARQHELADEAKLGMILRMCPDLQRVMNDDAPTDAVGLPTPGAHPAHRARMLEAAELLDATQRAEVRRLLSS